MHPFLYVFLIVFAALLAGAVLLHLLARLGPPGRRLVGAFSRAPMLDLPITYFTIAPLFFGPIVGGWWGLLGAVVGQVAAMQVWVFLHELTHPSARRGPRIVKVINGLVGRWRNHVAVWATALVVPVFWFVRLGQIFVYPVLTKLVGLPRYRTGDWVNVSRHKFDGLVGHDLIWCLYCDWMTGVWSLGSEMLRNVESFWCPIRFDDEKKCENCRRDFPDVVGGWAPADSDMATVAGVLEAQYGGRRDHPWFGHPARLTVNGQEPGSGSGESGEAAGAGSAGERRD